MRSRPAWIAAAAVVVVSLFALVLHSDPGAPGSALSRSPRGWLAARRVLEAHGATTAILDVAPESRVVAGVLVIVFPWQNAPLFETARALDHHVRLGGTLLVAFSGDRRTPLEAAVLEEIGLVLQDTRPGPPLDPRAWRRWSREVWSLRPDPSALPGLGTARVSALRRAPTMPSGGRALFTNEAGVPLVFTYTRGKGRVVTMPSEMLANGRLAEAGNADWLATLARSFDGPWTFDEYHHGLSAPGAAGGETETVGFLDLYLAQIVFLYALTVLALVRRLGPAWREPPVVSGSVAGFLTGLGGMHARLGHHRDAAAALAQRATELDKRVSLSDDAVRRGQAGPQGLLELARTLGRPDWRTKA